MSPQADYVVSNGTGAAVRSDINGQLAAIVSNNSGASAPATTYAYMLWADTSTNLLKLRNGANSAWITVGDLTAANLGLATLASPTFTGTATIPTLTVSTAANIPLGSAASPTLYFTGDSNTGLYSPGADQVALSTGGTGRLFIDSSGRCGIGDSAPKNTLDCAGNVGVAPTAGLTSNLYYSGGWKYKTTGYGTVVSQGTGGFKFSGTSSSGSADGAATVNDWVTIDNSGRLGIGTTSPLASLHVGPTWSTDVTIPTGTFSVVRSGGYSSGANAGIQLSGGYGDSGTIAAWHIKAIGSGSGVSFKNELAFTTTTAFANVESERARIDSSGRLLVGTSSARTNIYSGANNLTPPVQIETATAGYSSGLSLINYSADGYPASLTLGVSLSATQGTNALVRNSEMLGRISFNGNDGTNFRSAALIEALVDNFPGSADMPGRLVFSTTADGASSPTERFRISQDGRPASYFAADGLILGSATGAGTTTSLFAGVHSRTSTVTGGTTSIVIYTNGNIVNTNGSYTTISDLKLKENVVDAGSQWADLRAIKIRNWNFKAETGHETHRQIGPIAQELEEVCPGLVFETPDRDEDGNETGEVTKGVNQSVLYMKAVKALQEAMERIEQLEAKVAALESA